MLATLCGRGAVKPPATASTCLGGSRRSRRLPTVPARSHGADSLARSAPSPPRCWTVLGFLHSTLPILDPMRHPQRRTGLPAVTVALDDDKHFRLFSPWFFQLRLRLCLLSTPLCLLPLSHLLAPGARCAHWRRCTITVILYLSRLRDDFRVRCYKRSIHAHFRTKLLQPVQYAQSARAFTRQRPHARAALTFHAAPPFRAGCCHRSYVDNARTGGRVASLWTTLVVPPWTVSSAEKFVPFARATRTRARGTAARFPGLTCLHSLAAIQPRAIVPPALHAPTPLTTGAHATLLHRSSSLDKLDGQDGGSWFHSLPTFATTPSLRLTSHCSSPYLWLPAHHGTTHSWCCHFTNTTTSMPHLCPHLTPIVRLAFAGSGHGTNSTSCTHSVAQEDYFTVASFLDTNTFCVDMYGFTVDWADWHFTRGKRLH